MGRASVEIAYPGLWLADGVYATHGHYLDRHLTIPTFERLGVAAVERVLGMQPAGPDPLDRPDAERPGAPISTNGPRARSTRSSTPLPRGPTPRAPAPATRPSASGARSPAVARGRRRCAAGCSARSRSRGPSESPTGSASGPVQSDISAGAITRAGLAAMRDVIERIGLDARMVLFGHTHRRGPLPGDDDWTFGDGGSLVNTGSWVHSPTLLGETATTSPYWPGTIAVIEDGGDGAPPPARRPRPEELAEGGPHATPPGPSLPSGEEPE